MGVSLWTVVVSFEKMSMGSSKLNPYAAAYVPIAKRGDDMSKLAPLYSNSSTTELYPEEKGHMMSGDEHFEMDLEYLQTQFPSLSEQSLTDVYFVSGFDLDAACDMLNQIEHSDFETPQKLPDSLDIGDVSEAQVLHEFSNLKLKEEAGVSVTSSASTDYPRQAQPQN